MKPPCKDCLDRHEACHDSCVKYKEFIDNKIKEKRYNLSMQRKFLANPEAWTGHISVTLKRH